MPQDKRSISIEEEETDVSVAGRIFSHFRVTPIVIADDASGVVDGIMVADKRRRFVD